MGDEFIAKKNKSFTHRSERMHEQEFGALTLFADNPEEAVRLIRFRCPEYSPSVGEDIIFADVAGKEGVRVMLGNALIGECDANGSAEVRSILKDHPELHGILPGRIAREKDLAGYCKAEAGGDRANAKSFHLRKLFHA